jgi:4-diphosphocytidyl-2-C-methyl-D-erythritol kinase
MLERGALGASMSGSGPTVFGLFINRNMAETAYLHLRQQYAETFMTETFHPVQNI